MRFLSKTEEILYNAIQDLLDWEYEAHHMLPLSPEAIAELEVQGLIVDLDTGAVSADPDA